MWMGGELLSPWREVSATAAFRSSCSQVSFPAVRRLMRTLANPVQTGISGIVSGIVMTIIVGLTIVVFIVYMSNAERRIPVQYAKARS